MKELIEAQLKTGTALEIGQFYVVEMHGAGQPEMWWLYDEDYELVVLGSESVRAEWLRKYGEALPSHFSSFQGAIDEAVIRIKTEAKQAERSSMISEMDRSKQIKDSCLQFARKYKISGRDWITMYHPSLIGSNKHGDWYEHPQLGDESPLMLVTKAGVLYRSIWWDYDGEVKDNECC